MTTQTIEVKKVFVTDNQEQWIVFEEEMQAYSNTNLLLLTTFTIM
ncbi:hypothetical protein SB775_06805 [Peribacillus sp. SIMBA_075]